MKLFLLGLFLSLSVQAQTVVFIGDSLTEGYGLDPEEAYPAQLEILLKAKGRKDIKIVNGGVSGSTTASATQRVKWYLKTKPQIIVLALGANDGLRGLPVAESQRHLKQAIDAVKSAGVKVLLAEMKLPKNYGETYRRDFEQMYTALARTEKVPLLGFMLTGVGGVAALNQPDGIHPTAAGQKKIAENLMKALESHL
ncbi:MAG: arylesterase [Bacteriovoracia bacterium]